MDSPHVPLLGEYVYSLSEFPAVIERLQNFQHSDFLDLPFPDKFLRVSETLHQLIQEAPKEAFLLGPVIDFITRLNELNCLEEPYKFAQFEFWLNQLAGISYEENRQVRAKIMGKYLPRDEYQAFFPIGMNKIYEGTHFVSAHHSPDVDTMIASFWGWVDAFAARVGDSLHVWSLPGGPPESPVTGLLNQLFGKGFFTVLCRSSDRLTLAGIDVISRTNMMLKSPSSLVSSFSHGNAGTAILLVDQNHYKGDWRADDVEEIQHILTFFTSCLRWFENNVHQQLFSLFAQKTVEKQGLIDFVDQIFQIKIQESIQELQDKQRQEFDLFLQCVIGLQVGLKGTFKELAEALERLGLQDLALFHQLFLNLAESDLFMQSGQMDESRSKIFKHLQILIQHMTRAIQHIYTYCNRLDVVMHIKKDVFHKIPHTITLRTNVDNIRDKMQEYDYLTVVINDQWAEFFPVGVVWAKDIRKPILGTVTFRDFCNQDEVHMASYLSVISVIDHHKTSLKTSSTPMVLIGDTQSCNVLVAEQTVQINNRFSLGNSAANAIEKQIRTLSTSNLTEKDSRTLKNLLNKHLAAQNRGQYYVHPDREFIEYFCFIHAIFDDTDLLTKVSARDVECVAMLLNRMKSLVAGQEIEIISLEDIPRDHSFAIHAAKRILQNADTHSLYEKIYALKEKEIETSLKQCLNGETTHLFADTKEQNGCCRVGQTKLFTSNTASFQTTAEMLRRLWVNKAMEVNQQSPQIDLHMHMISTIPSASEVFNGKVEPPAHKDEIWFWIPERQEAYDHLIRFLTSFQATPPILNNDLSVELLGPKTSQLHTIFATQFSQVPIINTHEHQQQALAILKFKAGSINSRKAMISPYLPRLLS